MAANRAPSETPIPSTETAQLDGASPDVSEEEWKAMQTVLTVVYDYRMEDDYDPSKLFQRKVNKRVLPDYYTVVKEPMALSMIKAKINGREYKSFAEYVRDFALIPFNAQVYNLPDSGAYQDALTIKGVLEAELKKLVDEKIVSEEAATLPFLGEIPPHDEVPDGEEDEEEVEEEEEDDEDEDVDEDDDEDDEGSKRKKRRLPRSTAAITKRESGGKADALDKAAQDAESRKKRGRPPRVDTPMEARIKNIMKAMRKPRDAQKNLMISHFEKLPDKAVMPEYYVEVKNPMAMDVLKKKLKRKKYNSVDQFMKDVEIMFENAKSYNQDDSEIYKDAVHIQKEARISAEIEKNKKDTEFVMEDGRVPMPDGILLNGELWRVGDWVHIQNANDVTKPIVAQIYRTWQDTDNAKWVNACWYYRPEQTIHRFDRHFLENEVVKTGQYRDHPIEEVIDRCFVMFVTRYNKGRPRKFPADKEIYVCEARYNEEKHKLNKIKTWASCLPDEVREKDYEMDLFDAPKKMKKNPSPIAYLLADDAKEDDELPKPQWGAENAPPKIGAVHKRPRDPKDSPPPEPTPTPPPQPPPPPPRQPSNATAPQANGYSNDQRQDYNMHHPSQTPNSAATPSQSHHAQPQYTPSHHQPFHGGHPASPAAPMPHASPGSHAPPSFPGMPPHMNYTPHHSQAPPPHLQYTTPHGPTLYQHRPSATGGPPPTAGSPALHGYHAPKAPEVYHLADAANLSIPPAIREQFQRDEAGRVLFFTAPPLDILQPRGGGGNSNGGPALGHSARYLAAKAKRDGVVAEKRKRDAEEVAVRAPAVKKARVEREEAEKRHAEEATRELLRVVKESLATSTRAAFEELYGLENFERGVEVEMQRLREAQVEQVRRNKAVEERVGREREGEERVRRVRGLTALL